MSLWDRSRLARLRRKKKTPAAPEPPPPPPPQPAEPLVEMPAQPRRRFGRRARLGKPRRARPEGRLPRRPGGESGPIGRTGGAVGGGVKAAGGAVGGAASAAAGGVGHAARAVGGAVAGTDVYLRRRVVAVVAAILAIIALIVFAVPALPCQFPGGDACPPSDHAATLVPEDALAYVHIDTDDSSSQFRAAADLVGDAPTLSGQLLRRLVGGLPAAGNTATFDEQVRPWLGGELGLALLPASGRPQEIELLSVANRGEAEAYQSQIAGGAAQPVPYRGVDIVRGKGVVASALVGDFLVIGTTAGVEAVIDVETGANGAASLADSSTASSVRGALPGERVADVYLSPAGAIALAGSTNSLLSPLAPFFAPSTTKGVAIGLVAQESALELQIRSALDPQLAADHPGFFSAFPSFDATIADHLPPETLAYLGFGRPGQAITALLRQASSQQPGLAESVTGLLSQAKGIPGLALRGDLLTALGEEGALALEPAPGGGVAGGVPYLLYVGTGIDEKKTQAVLAHLQTPLAHALGSASSGGPARFHATRVAGIQTQTLTVSSTIRLSYAIVDGQLVVATNPAGIAAVARGGLASTPTYQQATANVKQPASFIAYLDLSGLVALGERAGLASDPAYTPFASDFHQLQTFTLSVDRSADQLATDGRLVLGSGSLQSPAP